MTRTELKIDGMSCSHCLDTVRKVLLNQRNVDSVEITLNPGSALVLGKNPDLLELIRAVEKAGFRAKLI